MADPKSQTAPTKFPTSFMRLRRLFKRADPILADGRRASEVRASLLAIMCECNDVIKSIEARLRATS